MFLAQTASCKYFAHICKLVCIYCYVCRINYQLEISVIWYKPKFTYLFIYLFCHFVLLYFFISLFIYKYLYSSFCKYMYMYIYQTFHFFLYTCKVLFLQNGFHRKMHVKKKTTQIIIFNPCRINYQLEISVIWYKPKFTYLFIYLFCHFVLLYFFIYRSLSNIMIQAYFIKT
jgi:hypothetical protein